jgi:CO dehydrogenase/acetyl-CoA synthase beta subunit
MKVSPEDVRGWIVDRIADVLVDLADDEEEDGLDVEELHDQMKNVAHLIVEALNVEVVDGDRQRATVTLGDDLGDD